MATQMVGDRYVIAEKLGSGGMGDVYRGVDLRNDMPVAVKVLKSELATPEMVIRFAREGDALRQLNHPNIVKLLDAIHDDNRHYLIMELVDGGSLDEILRQTPRLPIPQVLNIALDLADALTRAHRLHIIHRDIKPANVLMTTDGMPRLSDFGIARVIGSSITETGSVLGTAAYIAPEVLQGAPADARSDIWSLGVMLFEMLAGEHPFRVREQHPGAFIYAILNAPAPDLEALRPDAPTALVDVIYRMTMKTPGERIPRMRLVGAELEAVIAEPSLAQRRQAAEIEDTALVVKLQASKRFYTPSSEAGDQVRNNLPAQTTAFVGRENELAALERIMRDDAIRLVTIVAQGGMGKTRLALQMGSTLLRLQNNAGLYEHGIYFVDLAPISMADNIIGAVSEAVGYAFQQDSRDTKQQLLDYLRGKKMLLIMDNFEHVIAGRDFVQEVLQTAPQMKFLVTSREKLNLSAETVFALSGMDFPDWETPEDALEYSAVKLFMHGAQRVRADFRLETGDLKFVARICRAVYGTPLAILLAAAWLEVLSPREIAEELSRSLDFLESDMHDLPERQRSLRAVFEYSWNLLTDAERALFAQFSIFRGGFTRDAALEITGTNLRALTLLVNKSLLRRDNAAGRYDIHELLREYAAEKLARSPDAETASNAHARYYLGLIAQLQSKLMGYGQLEALNIIDAEFENIRAAWNFSVSKHDAEAVETAIDGLFLFLTYRNRTMDGEQLFGAAREVWAVDRDGASALSGKVWVRFPQGPPLAQFRRGLEIAQRHGDAGEIAFCQRLIGHWLSHTEYNQEEGIPMLEASLRGYQTLEDKFHAAQVLDDLGWSYNLMLDVEKQAVVVQQSLDLRREIGDKIGTGNSLRNMGGGYGGFFDESNRSFTFWGEAKEIAYELNDRLNIAWNAALQGANLIFRGELDRAEVLLNEAYPYAADLNHPVVKGFTLLLRGALVGLRDENYLETKRLIAEGFPPNSMPDIHVSMLMFALAVMVCGTRDIELLRPYVQLVRDMPPNFRELSLPLWFPCRLIMLADEGQHARAARFMRAYLETLQSFARKPFPMGWAKGWGVLIRLRAELQSALGIESFQAIWESGGQVSAIELHQEIHGFLTQLTKTS